MDKTIIIHNKEYIYEEYFEQYGIIEIPFDYLKNKLDNLSIEEQFDLYRLSSNSINYKTFAGNDTSDYHSSCLKSGKLLREDDSVKGIIVKEGIIVGIIYPDYGNRLCILLAGKGLCTYYTSDNNGAGYDEYEEHTYLNL